MYCETAIGPFAFFPKKKNVPEENNNTVIMIINGATCLSDHDWMIIMITSRVEHELIVKF